jgi:hypothetical protein
MTIARTAAGHKSCARVLIGRVRASTAAEIAIGRLSSPSHEWSPERPFAGLWVRNPK